jgi:hypothetical protein
MTGLADLFAKIDLNVSEDGRFAAQADRAEYRGSFAEGPTRTLALSVIRRMKEAADAGRTPSDETNRDAAKVFESIAMAALGRESDAWIDSMRSVEPIGER